MTRRLLILIPFACLGLTLCSHQQTNVTVYPEDRLAIADSLQSEGKCSRAVTHYEQLLSQFPTQEIAERARFNLARCRMELEDYDLAIHDFENFIDSYPKSDLVDDAMYMIALIYIRQSPRPERDQTRTVKALSELNLLLREYPDSDLREEAKQKIAECRAKLAEKEYLNGDLYLKLGNYESARIYFDSVISDYGDTPWARWALLGKAVALAKMDKPDQARQAYEQVLTDFPSSRASEEAARRLEELERATEIGTRTSSQD